MVQKVKTLENDERTIITQSDNNYSAKIGLPMVPYNRVSKRMRL